MARRRRFPCLFLKLEPGDPCWAEGFRYTVQQVDGDEHYFRTRQRAEAFLAIHSLSPKSDSAMARIRQRH